jgi:hypothetical protein
MAGYSKILPGSPMQIPAKVYNALVDAAAGQDFDRPGRTNQRLRQADIVYIRNDSDDDVAQYEILGLDEPLILPVDNLAEFQRQVAFKGVSPLVADHRGRYGIILEPIGAGEIGKAVIAGVVPVRLAVDPDNLLDWAEITDNTTGYLTNAASGSAFVLWVEDSGDTEQWALVRLGGSGSGLAMPHHIGMTQVYSAGTHTDITASSEWSEYVSTAIFFQTSGGAVTIDGIVPGGGSSDGNILNQQVIIYNQGPDNITFKHAGAGSYKPYIYTGADIVTASGGLVVLLDTSSWDHSGRVYIVGSAVS